MPPPAGCRYRAPIGFLVATEAWGGVTSDLGYLPKVSVFIEEVGIDFTSGGSLGCPRGRGRAQGVGTSSHPRGQPWTLLDQLFHSRGFFWSTKNRQKLACQLDSVWYSFSVKLKNKEKTETGTGL